MEEKLRHVNAVLKKLSQDEDLHDDLKLPAVKAAIDHWTNRNRLDPEKAQLLQHNRRVVYVLQQFQLLQNVCQSAGMPVPLDHLLLRKAELEASIINGYFKDKIPPADKKMEPSPLKERKEVAASAPKKVAHVDEAEHIDNPAPMKTQQLKPVAKETTEETSNVQTTSSGIHINDVIKFFIAVTVIMIAVVLAQLFR